jgi:hypothetical protein
VTPPAVPLPLQFELAPQTELHAQVPNPILDAGGNVWVDQKSITTYGVNLFGWKSGTDEATSGRWEVSTLPFGNDLDLNPAGMVLNGDAPTPLAGNFVPFPIDLSSLAPASGQSASIGNKGDLLAALTKTSPYAPPFSRNNMLMDPTEMLPILFGLPTSRTYSVHPPNIPGLPSSPAAPGYQAGDQPLLNEADLFIRYNVRVIPMKGEEAVGTASNTVFLDYYWKSGLSITFPPPPAKPYELQITAFQPPHFPVADYEFCVQVVENPKYGKDQSLIGIYNLYNPNPGQAGNIICPKHWSGGGKSLLEQFGDVLKEGLNLVSKIYKELGDFVVNVLDKINPACAVDQDVCHAMDQLIVAAAKTYCGLPPSIPNYDELKSAGEDYVAELAADQMEGAGIPCPQACKDQIKDGIDQAFEQIKAGYNNSSCWSEDHAHELGFEDGICVPEGVKTIPDPRGQYADGVLTVQVTRKPGFKDEDIPPSCSVYASAKAENDYWIGKSVGLEGPNRTTQEYISWKGTHLSGLGLVANGGDIPKLAENQTISIPLLIRRPNNIWWIPGHDLVWKGFIPAPNEDDWALLYHGSMLSATANSMCAQDSSNTWATGPVIGPVDAPVP